MRRCGMHLMNCALHIVTMHGKTLIAIVKDYYYYFLFFNILKKIQLKCKSGQKRMMSNKVQYIVLYTQIYANRFFKINPKLNEKN